MTAATLLDDPGPRPGSARRRQRRRRRALVVLLVLLLLVVVGLVVADRVARGAAESLVASRAQDELGLDAAPTVEIGGTSFLWQALRGRYESITLDAPTATRDGVTVQDVHADLTGVGLSPSVVFGSGSDLTVTTGSARVLLPWSELSERASAATGLDVVVSGVPGAGGGTLTATAGTTVLGRALEASISLTAGVEGQTLTLSPQSASVAGRSLSVEDARRTLGAVGLGGLVDPVSLTLGALPAQVDLTGTAVTAEGLQLTASSGAFSVPVPGL